jgi:hypothetical protein
MSGEESLAQVCREIETPKVKNLPRRDGDFLFTVWYSPPWSASLHSRLFPTAFGRSTTTT